MAFPAVVTEAKAGPDAPAPLTTPARGTATGAVAAALRSELPWVLLFCAVPLLALLTSGIVAPAILSHLLVLALVVSTVWYGISYPDEIRSRDLEPLCVGGVALALVGAATVPTLIADPLSPSSLLGSCSLVALLLGVRLRALLYDIFLREEQDELSTVVRFSSDSVLMLDPETAQERRVPIELIVPQDICVLRAGETVPVDGRVISGSCVLKERVLSGRASLRVRSAGQEVYAGSLIVKGTIELQANSTIEESHIRSFSDEVSAQLRALAEPPRSLTMVVLHTVMVLVLALASVLLHREAGGSWPVVLNVAAGVVLASLLPCGWIARRLVHAAGLFQAYVHGAIVRQSENLLALSRCREVMVHLGRGEQLHVPQRVAVELVDERVEEKQILSVALAIFSVADNDLAEAVAQSVDPTQLHPVRVEEVRSYPGLGYSALVEGAELSLGSEEFMIARGVSLTVSDVALMGSDGTILYVALGEELLAYLRIRKEEGSAAQLLAPLERLGVKPLLLADDGQVEADRTGKSIGLELSRIHGDQSAATIKERLRGAPSALFIAGHTTEQSVIESAALSAAQFDPIQWDGHRCDVTIFTAPLEVVPQLLTLGKRVDFMMTLVAAIAAIFSTALFVGAVTLVLSPWQIMTIVLLSEITLIGANRLIRRR